jgi:hypothetical protein
MISLSGITIPTPEPYDDKNPNKQRENYYYVQLQILAAAKAASDHDPFGILDAISTHNTAQPVSVDLEDLRIRVFGHAAIIESF